MRHEYLIVYRFWCKQPFVQAELSAGSTLVQEHHIGEPVTFWDMQVDNWKIRLSGGQILRYEIEMYERKETEHFMMLYSASDEVKQMRIINPRSKSK